MVNAIIKNNYPLCGRCGSHMSVSQVDVIQIKGTSYFLIEAICSGCRSENKYLLDKYMEKRSSCNHKERE